ncbi:calcium-binding protein [Actinoplanes sp. NPDC026623]|uniref:calcium-binding protein n=1 Tax=Actinoplanes sp. NPDC026623 TaxID=3155610 RepID=UPI00340A04FB
MAAVMVSAFALVASGPAQARTPVVQTFAQLPPGPWRINEPATVAGNVLTLGPYGYVGLFDGSSSDWSGNADNDLGWTVEARMRLDESVTEECGYAEPVRIWAGDHLTVVTVGFARGQVCLTYPVQVAYAMDTQSAFHTYKLDVRRERVQLSVDGRVVIAHTLPWSGGGTPALMAESLTGTSHWQYLRYDTTPSLPRCTMRGTPGPDRLIGGPGADVICGGDGADELIGGGGDDVLIGGLGADVLHGGSGRDTLVGGADTDVLDGGAQDDTLYGGIGQDQFPALPEYDGADVLSGGGGYDTADYRARTTPVTVSLDGQANDGAVGERDLVGRQRWSGDSEIEAVLGGAAPDTLTGDNWRNSLTGGAGTDVLRGLGGEDLLNAMDGAPGDLVDGGDLIDSCQADPGDVLNSCNEPRCLPPTMTMPPPPTSATPQPATPTPQPSPTNPTTAPPTVPTPAATPQPATPIPTPSCLTPPPTSAVSTPTQSATTVRGESGAWTVGPVPVG